MMPLQIDIFKLKTFYDQIQVKQREIRQLKIAIVDEHPRILDHAFYNIESSAMTE